MDKNKSIQKLLNGKATKKEIEELKQAVANGEISIGGDMNRSVVIIGSGNKVELTAEALSILKPEFTTEEPVAGESPYMGLRYFDTSDADLFYGREALTAELLKRVKNEAFLVIVGASGSGKSSVARAGLIPAWQKENERGVFHIITPTTHPLESLASSLTRNSESVTAISTLMDDMKRDVRSLRLYVKKALGETRLLLLVDQFEETFTLCKDLDERKAFIENLLSLADEYGTARVVITLRADFYHHCFEYEGLRLTLEKHQANLGAMTQEELREAILKPAETNGWDFQPGLVDLILQDIGSEPGALPLLSHALLESWKRRQGRMLTLQGYHDAGGVKKAIAQTAESVYNHLSSHEQYIARNIFLRLTQLGDGTQDTRRRVKLQELALAENYDVVTKVLKTLTDARLITTEQESVEVAHEALIRGWGTLLKWLDEDREGLRIHRHLTESTQEWSRRKRTKDELYRGERLNQLENWLTSHYDMISQLETEFIKESKNSREQDRKLRKVGLSVSLAVLCLICSLLLMPAGILNRMFYRPVDMENYWVTIPAGEFHMGSENYYTNESPEHTVYLDEYQIGKYEITNRQYNQCIKAGVCSGFVYTTKLNNPVKNVNSENAITYCKWVGGRLPSEAEWEKAARGTDGRTYPWGEKIDCSYANYSDVDCGSDTTPVGYYENGKSPYGVYDMSGNVWEWVNDFYEEDYYSNSPILNPLGPDSGQSRVLRGGSWDYDSSYARTTKRDWYDASQKNYNFGFRCARSLEGQ